MEACEVMAVHSGVRVRYEVSRLQTSLLNHLVIYGSRGQIYAPQFFTEASSPAVKIVSDGHERVIRRMPGNPYRKVVEDFAAAALDSSFVSPGTTLSEAIGALRMIEGAEKALDRPIEVPRAGAELDELRSS